MFCVNVVIWWCVAQLVWEDFERLILSYEVRNSRYAFFIEAAFCSLVMFPVLSSDIPWDWWMWLFGGIYLFNLLPVRLRLHS